VPGVAQSKRWKPEAYCSDALVTGRGEVPITSVEARELAEELMQAANQAEQIGRNEDNE
jgi:hypothetical protein